MSSAGASRPVLVAGAIAVMVLIWGTTWAVIRLGLEGVPPFAGVSIRFAIAGAVLFVLGRIWRIPAQPSRRLHKLWAVQTAFSFCISYGVVYWAEQWVPSGLAAVVFATLPLFVTVLAHWWLPDEPLRWLQVGGVALGVFGVGLIFSDELTLAARPEVQLPALVLLISPLVAAIAHVCAKKWGSGIHPLNVITVPMLATGGIMGALAVLFERGRTFELDGQAVFAVLYLSIMGSALTFSLYFWVLERVAATRLALITLVVPVVAVAVGTLLLEEPFSGRAAAGVALVLTGVAAGTRRR